jgi:hypothetical protein
MSRSPAYDDHHEYTIERKQVAAVGLDGHLLSAATEVATRSSIADMQQAKYFQALLDERHSQIHREICDKTAALAQSQATDDASAMRRLRRGLAATCREQADLDRVRNSLRVRLAADVAERARVTRHFEIVMTRRRAGWRMAIPEFDIVLTDIDSRTDAEAVSRSIISAITGLPTAQIRVRSRLARQSYRRSQQ